jgi:transcriptional repressor NrdR
MFCPKCAEEKTRVKSVKTGMITKRLRICRRCGYRFLSVEAIECDDSWKEYKTSCVQMGLFDDADINNNAKK